VPAKARSSVLYVSPQGNDRWTGRLPDPNARGTDGPLATVAAAQRATRRLKKSADAPVTVYLRGGRHRIAKTLLFGPKDSFVTYAAYQDEQPILDSGAPVAGWCEETVEGRRMLTADASPALRKVGPFRQLFVSGRRARRARLPDEGFYWMADVPGTQKSGWPNRRCTQKRIFFAAEGQWRPWRNLTDTDVVIIHWWHEDRRAIASFNPRTRKVVLAEETVRALVDDLDPSWAKYYIDNVFEGLARPGDWYLDRKAKKVYYLPRPGETAETIEAFAAGPAAPLRLEGHPDRGALVEQVRFVGLVFEHTDWRRHSHASQSASDMPGVVTLIGACQCALENCIIRHSGIYGVDIQDGCIGNRIVGCTIEDLGAGGIMVSGTDHTGPRARRTGHTLISDNHLHALGRVHHAGAGIILKHTFANVVAHNHIHDLYYTGVSCGWIWGYSESVARDNRIEKNHIHQVGQGLLNDMGGIYLLGVQPGTALRGNLIHDVRSSKYGGWAIYPDEGSSHIVIENNVCYDCSSQVFHLHFGRESVLRNNIWAFAKEGIIAISRGNQCNWPQKGAAPDGRVSGALTFERNIVLTDGAPVFLGGMDDESGNLETRTFWSDLNLFWDVGGKPVRCANGGHLIAKEGYKRFFTWKEWQAFGYDRHSVIADPKCADLAKRDFRLADDSPAWALGFQAIDLSDVGPRPADKRTHPDYLLGAGPPTAKPTRPTRGRKKTSSPY
jgi:hypothetical protein